jgi:hypothetical protein
MLKTVNERHGVWMNFSIGIFESMNEMKLEAWESFYRGPTVGAKMFW